MEKNSNKKNLGLYDAEILNAALKKYGFLFPETEKEIEQFENCFGKTDIELPEHLKEPDFMFSSNENHNQVKVINMPKEISHVDYYRRTVLAAEIVYELHNEMTLGHLKLQKLIYLTQRTEKIDLPVNFLKQAMGPYDPKLMRSIDKQLSIKKWFVFQISEKLKYKPLEKAGSHKDDFNKYYKQEKEKIHWLIDTFRKVKSPRVEIIATLFACWEELLKRQLEVNDRNLLTYFFNWSEAKQKFTEGEVLKEIPWMRENNLFPKEIVLNK
ncbi:hypothetical protein [Parafilimonas sp.]|uniref:hypothetical protein n=1 Tax=Parafilimonas sp. TaxID=1969739 RepID=UPI003F7F7CF7